MNNNSRDRKLLEKYVVFCLFLVLKLINHLILQETSIIKYWIIAIQKWWEQKTMIKRGNKIYYSVLSYVEERTEIQEWCQGHAIKFWNPI